MTTSNGNDGVVLKGGKGLADIKGRSINIVSSRSPLPPRPRPWLCRPGRRTSRRSTPPMPTSSPPSRRESTAVVTWNPQLMEVKGSRCDRSLRFEQDPREIEDPMVINTETPKDNGSRQGAGRYLVRATR